MDVAVVGWVAALSVLAFAAAAWDKAAARRARRRLPERTLLGLALAGGSGGLLLAMLLLRHKTRKGSFLLAFGLILAAQAALLGWLLW